VINPERSYWPGETGAIDNAGLRAVTGLDTLTASPVLGRLHHQHCLLIKGGAGPATYYQLADWSGDTGELPLFGSQEEVNTGDLNANTSDLDANTSELNLPERLRECIGQLSAKARKDKLWPVLVWLCGL
jgi:ATP-dependent DNA helicase RecG